MSRRAEAFEHWIRTSFVQMNTELENLYFANEDRAQVIGYGDPIKASLRDEGHGHVVALLAEGNTGEGFDSAYGVLGSVGLYLGSLRRHELTNPAREERSPFPEASSLALHVGASLGMAPRFSTGTSRPTIGRAPGFARALRHCTMNSCSSTRTRAEFSRCSARRMRSRASSISASPVPWRMSCLTPRSRRFVMSYDSMTG